MKTPDDSVDVTGVAEHPTRNRAIAGILAWLVLHAWAVAAVRVVPFLLAVLLSRMLSPAVRFPCDWKLRQLIAVTRVTLTPLSLLGNLFASLIGPAREWADQVPTSIRRIKHALSAWRSPLREASQAGEKLAQPVVVVLTAGGPGHFESTLPASAVPAAIVMLNALEERVTPQTVGRWLALDPVMAFLALMPRGCLWGPAGLLLAMPLLTCLRIIAERIPDWSPLAKLQGS